MPSSAKEASKAKTAKSKAVHACLNTYQRLETEAELPLLAL
jgi:hypothetical protein